MSWKFPIIRILELDSPFFWGIVREMTSSERASAEDHGRFDDPPMSILGVTSESLAAVEGKDEAEFIVRACNSHDLLLAALQDCVSVMNAELNGLTVIQPELRQARAAIAKATGKECA